MRPSAAQKTTQHTPYSSVSDMPQSWQPPHTPYPWKSWFVAIGLCILLVLQILLADRARWAQYPNYRPWMLKFCQLLHCNLPQWHEPTAFTMLQRDISTYNRQQSILSVQATFRNDAHWPQSWPTIALNLSDADGSLIGVGFFQPKDYLGHSPAPAQATIAPGQSVHVGFFVRDPSTQTSAFSFEFH